ncbi:DUF896 domain-containing protein [Mobilibacterium timonense]|uniref:DUF896 domain-containing protein n=1 Tax=Mobilibacterium timonense TaxID=1871012 RepID=UPI000986B627|nr:DUF896 domain-containing protein [Mobilibacterium timonense]
MEKKKIDRINELARLKKERELSPEEKEEQQALRKEFLREIRADLKQTLDNIEIVDDAAPAQEKKVPESDLVDHITGETISIKEYNAE